MSPAESMKEARDKLPIFEVKDEILSAVHRNKTVIFLGETASGKTTQIPQFLYEGGFARNKCIAITQPRRVATMTIAKRVAEEVRTELGGKVGFRVRFENCTSSATKIKYLTDGMLLREAVVDPLLTDYAVVILDEAHERTLNNDILLGIVKLAQKLREEAKLLRLRIIIASATLDYKHFSSYFDDAYVYSIRGREYSIDIMNANKKQEDYVFAALVTVFQIHQKEEEGDILVFCTGQEEITSMISQVQKTSVELPAGTLRIIPIGLYAALPAELQIEAFRPTPPGCRKVIFSTNIAETSVTIPGVKYVVDTGMVKEKSYNSVSGFDVLTVQRISMAQADQRAGRAGREVNGICYRLYTVEEQSKFKEYTVPEILRCCLSSVFLEMVAIGIKNIHKFDFIDKPTDENINAALKQLKLLDAIVERDGNIELTECGKKMVKFPLDPRFSKMILTSKKYKCTDEILTIISLLSVESIFYHESSEREDFHAARQKFITGDGDLIMLLNVYREYKTVKGDQAWCRKNFINVQNIRRAITIRKQLFQICQEIGVKPCSCRESENIRKCIASGLFMNTAVFIKKKTFKMVEGHQEISIHPSSCFFNSNITDCCVYVDLVQSTKVFMRNITRVQDIYLREIAPAYFKDKRL